MAVITPEIERAPAGSPGGSSSLDAAARQTLFESIETAATSYDPAQLPLIRPYLTHSDPEVRAAALNGVVTLGDAAGAPLLREAAKQAANSQEAIELLSKADYLELPSAPIVKRPAGARRAPANSASGKPAFKFAAPPRQPKATVNP